MHHRRRVIIIGAGAAGHAAAIALDGQLDGVDVVVVGAENNAPYDRTTVNKGLLSGAVSDSDIALPDTDVEGIDWRPGRTAQRLDVDTRTVWLSDGTSLTGDAIVIATGATPRELSVPVHAAVLDRVVQLRTAEDTHRLSGLVGKGSRVVIAGAGLIGSETAAVLVERGAVVTLVGSSTKPLGRHVGETVAGWVADAHRTAGVDLRTGTTVSAVAPFGSHIRVDLTDGSSVIADVVLTALGASPATGWLDGSGVPVRDGAVLVDANQRVMGLTGVYAAGDLAAYPGVGGEPTRSEHWGAAKQQGRMAAATLLVDLAPVTGDGDATTAGPQPPLPSYSTYVHGTKLTILGNPAGATHERLILGKVGDERFAVAQFDGKDRLIGAVGVGGARVVNQLRTAIERRTPAAALGLQP